MLKVLYGEEKDESLDDKDDDYKSDKEQFETKLKKRKEFSFTYCNFLMVQLFLSVCCCISKCVKRNGYCKRGGSSYRKF